MSTVAFASTSETIPTTTEEATKTSSSVVYEATYKISSDSGITLVSSSGDSNIMPLSTISGYNQKSMYGTNKDWNSNNYLYINCGGSGYGGMGTIDEVQFHDLWQNNLQEYLIVFSPADGVTYVPDYYVRVWIYG